jgi:putative lipoprotein
MFGKVGWSVSFGAAAALCACAADGPPRKPAVEPPPVLRVRVYDCEGTQAVVQQLGDDAIELVLPTRRVRLPRVRSGSGAKYAARGTALWTKGPIALLELPDDSAAQCEEDRPRSLREDARVRGVHYRGLGSEPSWRIEIGPANVAFEYDYGERRLVLPMPEPQLENGHRTYEKATPAHHLRVAIEDRTCLDSMTGDAFDTAVEVTLDGRTFRGCGDVLH